ncbi:unnamed protein product [Heterobilharzia americana]|nr:unnamed protein product [Heterobilharzia americana]
MLGPVGVTNPTETYQRQLLNCSRIPASFSAYPNILNQFEKALVRFEELPNVQPLKCSTLIPPLGTPLIFRGSVLAVANSVISPGCRGTLQTLNNGFGYQSHLWQRLRAPEKSLGFGAFGVVWLVIDPRTGEQAALKRIPSVFESTMSAKRAYRELKVLFSMRHENIVRLIDVVKVTSFSAFNEISILCEYMDTDLHKIIASSQYLSLEHTKLFVYQILRGLKYLHSAGVIHRDLKPGNLLVNADCLLKICDFGLARSVPSVDTEVSCNPLTLEVVTQFYRPPELLLGSSFYTSAVDLWSVGCILGELLCRRILFQSSSSFRQLDMIFDLLGSPTTMELVDLIGFPSSSIDFIFQRPIRPLNHAALSSLLVPANTQYFQSSTRCLPDPDLVALFTRLLSFGASKRLTAEQALNSPFLAGGRTRFHTFLCHCCPPRNRSSFISEAPPQWHNFIQHHNHHLITLGSAGNMSSSGGTPPSPLNSSIISSRNLTFHIPLLLSPQLTLPTTTLVPHKHVDLEPTYQSIHEFTYLNTEIEMSSLIEAKQILWNLIQEYFQRDPHRTRVIINNSSPNFESFINECKPFK